MPVNVPLADDFSQQALNDARSGNRQTALLGDIASGQAVNVAGTNLTVDSLLAQLGLVQPQFGQEQHTGSFRDRRLLPRQAWGRSNSVFKVKGWSAGRTSRRPSTASSSRPLLDRSTGWDAIRIEPTGDRRSKGPAGPGLREPGGEHGGRTGRARGREHPGGEAEHRHQRLPEHPGPASHPKAADRRTGPVRLPTATVRPRAAGRSRSTAVLLGNIARGEAGLGLSAQANNLWAQQQISQINYGLQQAGLQGQQSADQIAAQIGAAQGQGATYQAGAIGQAALLGGVNLNAALSGGG